MTVRGITKRWLFSGIGLIMLVLVLLIISFGFIIKSYFYSGIKQTLDGRSNELANIFRGYSWGSYIGFNSTVRQYVEEFPDKDLMELMAFDGEDKVMITSAGFSDRSILNMPDFNEAKASEDNYGFWVGNLESGEKVMAVTRCLHGQGNKYLGAIRYIVSLENVDTRIYIGFTILMFLSILIVVTLLISGIYFINSITNPVTEIARTAKLIARGNFKAKLNKKYNDEIGELCDTINYMAEELGIAERLKNDFISSISHEIRTPLTAIKGWAETMQMGDDVDKSMISRGLDIIVHETERLSGMVEELLDFSRLQSGRMVMKMDKIDILAELGEAVYIFKERAISENKSLIYNEPKIISPIYGDKNRLKQVFINIIDNALKYTSEGGGVSVGVTEKDGRVCVSVTDNGCGIPKGHIDKVKEKFYKANSVQRGSGIGLAIVDEIVNLHKGKLDIISEENFGTTVMISFPVACDENKENDI